MNLNQLKALVKVVQTGSFKEAARHLQVSQPAITQRIQALEEYMKTRLLSKDSDGIQLTSHGRTLYERSLKILMLWDQVEEEIWGTKVTGRIIIGASTIPSQYLLPQILNSYRKIYSDVRPQLRISGTSEVVRWLRERTIDVAITGDPLFMEGVSSFVLAEDQLKLITPTDHHWDTDQTWIESLTNADWIIREPESDTRRTIEKHFKKQDINPKDFNTSGQVESTEAVIASVEAGLGISIVSALASEKSEQFGRIKVVDIPELQIFRSFYCSYLEDQKNQSVIATFLSFLQNQNK